MLSDIRRYSHLLTLRRGPVRDRAALRRFQSQQLRSVIAHAYMHVPYYRELLDGVGVSPDNVREPDDLKRLPITTRDALQSCDASEIVSDAYPADQLTSYSTSGTSGRPIDVRRTRLEDRILATIRTREMRALGLRARDRVALIRTLATTEPSEGGMLARLQRVLAGNRWDVVDCMKQPDQIAEELMRLRPHVIAGYPGYLSRIARTASRDKLRSIGIRAVFPGGEMLSDQQRIEISDAFAAPVWDTYGCYELDLVARECPAAGGYHVCDDGLILEVVRDGVPVEVGERGHVVATALHSHAMPLIRYRVGDLVERGPTPCACGAPVSTIRAIVGRAVDMFTLPDGQVVHPYGIFIPIRSRFDWIRHHRVHQLTVDHVRLELVAEPIPADEEIARIAGLVRAEMGEGVRVDVELVEEILPGANGKIQIYSSAVPS